MAGKQATRRRHFVRVRVKEFGIPPIHDGLVLGKRAPIGCAAIRKALHLLAANSFAHYEVEDDVVSNILVRAAIVRRVPSEKLIAFVLEKVKPLMGAEEILHLDIEIELALEEAEL